MLAPTGQAEAGVVTSAGEPPLVRFQGVQKTFDGQTLVIDNLDLDVERGEFLTLLGPSGSGKTTTMMMLAGFEEPTAGEISLAGRSLANVPPHKRHIGMVFQDYALFPHMSVAQNVGYALRVRGIGRRARADAVHRALQMVELDAFGDRRPAQLSGGQQQRVALARALVFEPDLILLDEPLGALDRRLREHMQIELKHLHRKLGVTMVYVTHDQEEALTMSDRIAVFNDGRIQQLADPRTIYDAPENAFVASFVGDNNALAGTVQAVDEHRCIVALPGGGHISATQVGVREGGRTTLSIRPERVLVAENKVTAENVFEGQILEAIFLGDQLTLRMAVFGRDDFIVKVPATHPAANLTVHARVSLGWSADDCRALVPVGGPTPA